MKGIWTTVGFLGLGAWLIVMVFPVWGGSTKYNGFSALSSTGTSHFDSALLATVVLLALAGIGFFSANRSDK